MPQCLKSKIRKQTNPKYNFLCLSGLKTTAVQKLLHLSFTNPAAGEGAYVGWAEAAINLNLPSHCVRALSTVLLLPEKGKRQPRNVIGQDKLEKKIFSLICEEKHTESPSQRSCGLWVKSVLLENWFVFSYGVRHLYLGTGWKENKKYPYSCS